MQTNLLQAALVAVSLAFPLAAQSVTATATAATTMSVVATALPSSDSDSLPAGTDLTGGATLSASAFEFTFNSTASSNLTVATTASKYVKTIDVRNRATTSGGLIAQPGSSSQGDVAWTLTSPQPTQGVLRVTFKRTIMLPPSNPSARIDIDDDGSYEWTAGNGAMQTWETPLTIAGTRVIRTNTAAMGLGNQQAGDASLTLEFEEHPITSVATAYTQLIAATGTTNEDTAPAGTDVTDGLTLSSTSFFFGYATADFEVATSQTSTVNTLSVTDESHPFQVQGLSASTGPHEILWTLSGSGVVRGTLCVRYVRPSLSGFNSSSARIDIDNDGSYEWESVGDFGEQVWETPLDFVGSRSVRVRTRSGGSSTGEGQLTVEFVRDHRIVLPDNHYLTADPAVVDMTGTGDYWRDNDGRFQILYEASHFLNHGVTGPVTIRQLRFRLRDGQPDAGGRSWDDVQVRIGSTWLDTNTMSLDFDANFSGTQTVSGATGTLDVTMRPSYGAVPNNDCIVLDLEAAGATIEFDPTSLRPNLLIDVVMPTNPVIPTNSSALRIQDTLGTLADTRGRAIYSSTPTATTGTADDTPPVVTCVFEGDGGYSRPVPATNEWFGAACGGEPSSFYQAFLSGQKFDLDGTMLRLTPDSYPAPSYYTVTVEPYSYYANALNATPDSTADDGVTPVTPLGFAFAFPGGLTSEIVASTNGFVWLSPTATGSSFRPQTAALLGDPAGPRLAPFWSDLNCGVNSSISATSGLHVRTLGTAPNRQCVVTWRNVGVFDTSGAGQVSCTIQCVLHEATGVIEYGYFDMPTYCSTHRFHADPDVAAIVGFSRGEISGTPSVDPQSRDLSIEVPFSTSVEGSQGNIGLRVTATPDPGGQSYGARLYDGQALTWNVTNIPPGSLVGVLLLDFQWSRPGLAIPGIHKPGCIESTSIAPQIHEVFLLPPGSVNGVVPFFAPGGYLPELNGAWIVMQFALLDGLFGGPDLVTGSSNAVRHTLGLR